MRNRLYLVLIAVLFFVLGYCLQLVLNFNFTLKTDLDPVAIVALFIPIIVGLYIALIFEKKKDIINKEIELLSKEISKINSILEKIHKTLEKDKIIFRTVVSLLKELSIQINTISKIDDAFTINMDTKINDQFIDGLEELNIWSTLEGAREEGGVIFSDGEDPCIVLGDEVKYSIRRKNALDRKLNDLHLLNYRQLVYVANA